MIKKTSTLIIILGVSILHAQKPFLAKDIHQYLNKENPFYYQAIGEQYIAKGREEFYQGSLDTQIRAKYDKKDYPVTTGTYQEVELFKSLGNGIELSMGYRNAYGTQEYNNIKTGKDGEFLSSVKIPLFSVLYDISKNKVDIKTAQMSRIQAEHKSDLNLLKLYFNISKIYYQLLLQKELVQTQEALTHKAHKTREFIIKQVEVGSIPAMMKIEIDQMIIQREKETLYQENNFKIVQNIFLQYLGIDKETFSKQFLLPSLSLKNRPLPPLLSAITTALDNRPDLKIIDFELEKLALKKSYNNITKYPKIDLKISTLYDPINQEGYKLSLNFNMPIENRKYSGMAEVLKKEKLMKKSEKLKLIEELRTNIINLFQKIETKKEAIQLSQQELILVERLESIEIIKIHEGVGNLMFLNQREITVLKVQQKLLKDYYDLLTYYLEFDYLTGKI